MLDSSSLGRNAELKQIHGGGERSLALNQEILQLTDYLLILDPVPSSPWAPDSKPRQLLLIYLLGLSG